MMPWQQYWSMTGQIIMIAKMFDMDFVGVMFSKSWIDFDKYLPAIHMWHTFFCVSNALETGKAPPWLEIIIKDSYNHGMKCIAKQTDIIGFLKFNYVK